MTYNDFKTKVKSLLLYDQDSDDPQVVSYIDALIVEWMYEAMFYVDNYRVGNTDTFLPAAVDDKCDGGRVDLPAELYKLESVAIVKKAVGEEIDAYVVSGAGTDAVNGEYVRNGDAYNGSPLYTPSGEDFGLFYMWYSTVGWFITNAIPDPVLPREDLYYNLTDESESPPLTGWITADGWESPAPTLALADPIPGCETVIDLDPLAWDQRDEILNGQHCNKYTIDSRATEIYFRPIPEDNEETGETQWLRIEWEGTKTDYSGQEVVPYGFDAAKNCADFINMNLAVKKNDKPAKANRFEKMFDRGMQRLFKTQRAKSQQG